MGALPRIAALLCFSLLVVSVTSQDASADIGCPDDWVQFEDSCYRLTDAAIPPDDLDDTCEEMGGDGVSIHSKAENDIVANVARGRYVWIGLKVTGENRYTWEDGTAYSYKNFLPSGNHMLNQKYVGAPIFQQSCRRWNYGSRSQTRYGVCKRPTSIVRCPDGSLERDGVCYFISHRAVPWWDASVVCHETDPHATVAGLTDTARDHALNRAVAGNFGGTTLLVQVENPFSPRNCTYVTFQYGQRTSNDCWYSCAEMYTVLCKRPKYIAARAETTAPMKMMPPIYRGPLAEPLTALETCPPGWDSHDGRCVRMSEKPSTRLMADHYCQQMDSRVAAVRGGRPSRIILAKVTGEADAWVVDIIAAKIHYDNSFKHYVERNGYSNSDVMLLPEYTVLTSDGGVITRSADEEMPVICELCQQSCSPGSVKFAGHCYQLLDGERSRQNASDSCRGLGGTLVSIESAVENNFVTSLAYPAGSEQCRRDGSSTAVWLGLQRGGLQYSWAWDDCSEYGVQFWAPDSGSRGYCAALAAGGLWSDDTDQCDLRLLTVCEWDPCDGTGRNSLCGPAVGSVY